MAVTTTVTKRGTGGGVGLAEGSLAPPKAKMTNIVRQRQAKLPGFGLDRS